MSGLNHGHIKCMDNLINYVDGKFGNGYVKSNPLPYGLLAGMTNTKRCSLSGIKALSTTSQRL